MICGATIDEAIAGRVLADRDRILPPIIADVRARLDIVREWMRAQDDVRVDRTVRRRGRARAVPRRRRCRHRSLLRHAARELTARTSGPGHWFEVDDRHFRLGFGWPTRDELRAGLTALSKAATA